MSANESVLLIDRLPDPEATQKGATIGRNVSGMNVANVGLVQSLLRYGTFDRYLFIQENLRTEKIAKYQNRERLQAVHLGNAECLSEINDLVLLTTSHHLAKYVPIRHLFGHLGWPICGLAHGLSPNFLIPQHVWNSCSALHSHDVVVCSSECQRRDMQAIDQGIRESSCLATRPATGDGPSYEVIPLGIELDSVPSDRSSKHADWNFVVLTIARFSLESKVDLRPFIAAFLKNSDLPHDSVFIIAGDDPDGAAAQELQAFAAQFVSKRRVTVLSAAAENRRKLLKLADVALCLSDNVGESFGLFVVEAMLSGLPVVAPAWNGFRELVTHGETGLLASTAFMGDTELLSAFSMLIDPAYSLSQRVVIDVSSVMGYLAQLASNPELRWRLGTEAHRRALERYTWEKIVPQYESLWEEQIERGRHLRKSKSNHNNCSYYDYGYVFGHKASQTISLDTLIFPSDTGLNSVHKLDQLFSPPRTAGFSSQLDDKMLETVCNRPGLTLEQLVDEMISRSYQQSQILTQVARLLKYGLLRHQIEAVVSSVPRAENLLDRTQNSDQTFLESL